MFKISTRIGRHTVVCEGNNIQEAIIGCSQVSEFPRQCEKCGCEDIAFKHRRVDANDFFELQCQNLDCRAVFKLGQHKSDAKTLFPKWSDGWTIWQKENNSSSNESNQTQSTKTRTAPSRQRSTTPRQSPRATASQAKNQQEGEEDNIPF